jgi:neutral ceramidase
MRSSGLALGAVLLATVAGTVDAAPTKPATALRVGVAKIDITPTDLTNLNPFGGGSYTKVHDPIFARALVLGDGSETVAILSFDLPEVGDMRAFRQRIERETGIKYDHIMLAATHNHSAPRLGGISPGTRAQKPSAESERYSAIVFDKVIALIKSAKAAAQPARFGTASGHANINVNRDFYTPGKGWGMGYNPEGDSEKAIRILRFDTVDGKPLAVLFTYGVHSTVTFQMKEVTGDLAGAAERYIEENGDGVTALFVMGAGGEQVPRVQRLRPGRPEEMSATDRALAWRAMDAQGLMLGSEVLRAAKGIEMLTSDVRIRATAREAVCPTKAAPVQPNQMATLSTVTSPIVTLQLGTIMLNSVAIASVSGEVVTPIYRRLMRETPLTDTVFATLVNDRIGYIADDAAYDTPLFEVNGSPAARGCAEPAIVGNLTDMIAKLNR